MPGIFGIVDVSGSTEPGLGIELSRIVEQMSVAMRYESAYSTDILLCAELGACVGRVGWPTDGGSGGVRVLRKNVALVTSGEPFCESHEDGAAVDADVSGIGAREAVQLYERLGENAVRQLNGAFAGFLIDRRRRTCALFNDRYGMERLFLYREGNRILFSSEAKAILAVAPSTRAFDPEGLSQLVGAGCTWGKRSLFNGIEVLEGGTVVSFPTRDAVRRRALFNRAALEDPEYVTQGTFVKGFGESFSLAIDRLVRRAPRVGVSLTGGLDSRMIMACLRAAPGSIPCYTFGSMYRETFDVSVGRQVAAHCGQPHQVLELGADFLRNVRTDLEKAVFISDGYLGMSGAAELYLNRLARSIAPVRMTGNWGGELIRGVRAFKYVVPEPGFLAPELQRRMQATAEEFGGAGELNPLSFTLFHQAPNQGYGRYAIERSQVMMRSPFMDNKVVEWLYKGATSERRESALAVIQRERPDLLEIPTDQGLLGAGAGLTRFARRLYRQGLSRAEYWTSHGAPHVLARLMSSAPGGLLEKTFRGRHKFQHLRLWFREELSELARQTMLDGNQGDLWRWFDIGKVEGMLDEHRRGRSNYTEEIDKVVTVALASRQLLKASSGQSAVGATLGENGHACGSMTSRSR